MVDDSFTAAVFAPIAYIASAVLMTAFTAVTIYLSMRRRMRLVAACLSGLAALCYWSGFWLFNSSDPALLDDPRFVNHRLVFTISALLDGLPLLLLCCLLFGRLLKPPATYIVLLILPCLIVLLVIDYKFGL